MGFMKGSILI